MSLFERQITNSQSCRETTMSECCWGQCSSCPGFPYSRWEKSGVFGGSEENLARRWVQPGKAASGKVWGEYCYLESTKVKLQAGFCRVIHEQISGWVKRCENVFLVWMSDAQVEVNQIGCTLGRERISSIISREGLCA